MAQYSGKSWLPEPCVRPPERGRKARRDLGGKYGQNRLRARMATDEIDFILYALKLGWPEAAFASNGRIGPTGRRRHLLFYRRSNAYGRRDSTLSEGLPCFCRCPSPEICIGIWNR